MKLNVDQAGVRELADKLREGLEKAHDLSTQEVWGNLMEHSPQDQGRLAGSWKYRRTGSFRSLISTSVSYAMVQNDGVDPFTIRPKNGQALYWKGAAHPVKKVEHPGFKGKHYIEQSIDEAGERHEEFVRSSLRKVQLL
ncbi:HK97 gp10 family phage protein [Marinococcus luteus]|uniref:HK97 gp10 family phage protein n=1 Tax=Marinococcus luteus TaxID=1122204 RepID=UPI002ACD0630|nr:HK97 gp10 family phage protein [Marinococcus luteus]MDZ5782107.1 HK97 gp10 family phage protein [Marinococcus luteus]